MRTMLLITSVLLSANASAAERVVRETIPVNADVRFSIDLHRAELEVTTGSVDAVELIAYIQHDDQEVLDEVEVHIEQSRSDVAVEVYYDDPDNQVDFDFIGLIDYEYPQIRFVIVVPDDASLDVEAHRSQLEIAAPAGRIDIDTSRTTGRITNVRNDLDLVTTRGDIDIEVQSLHDMDIEAQRSDIRLDIFGATDYTLAGDTQRGEVRVTGQEIATEERDRGMRVNHVSGSGSNFVSFDVERGNIMLNFRN